MDRLWVFHVVILNRGTRIGISEMVRYEQIQAQKLPNCIINSIHKSVFMIFLSFNEENI